MDDPRRFLPLTAQQFHILLALVDDDRHGYAIIKDIAERTRNGVRLGTGTLYTAIARLAALSLVEESPRRAKPAEDDDRRRYYRITPLGRSVLTAETTRLDTLVHHARRKGIRAGASHEPSRSQ